MIKYEYKIKKNWMNQVVYFYKPSTIIYLNNGTSQDDLKKLYNAKHPAITHSKLKEENE